MPRYHVRITGQDYDAMADFVRKYKITVARHTVEKLKDGYRVDAHANGTQIRRLEAAGYKVKRIENADQAGKKRQVEFKQDRLGIYFLGGVHAREWGSPDILINFAQQLTQAYSSGTGISIGSKNFTASRIRSIMNNKDVYVFPQANPDGRNYSITRESMWRKNRRPAPSGHKASRCVGVDINRNYDFLWDYPHYFDPQAPIANLTDPGDHDVYIGPRPISEPETKNAVWIFDTFPNIGYFIDVHSYSEAILYCWGDDVLQTIDPNMNFRNAAFNGQRGIANDTAYKEYMEASDKTAIVSLATRMREAIRAVRGREYTVEQAIGLYPTAGTSDDYAFSRHITDSSKPKIYSYTIEWGSPDNPTPFHPPYREMRNIIQEITAALLEFCWRAGA